jgi:capsular polysaccharide biosynthesis protein
VLNTILSMFLGGLLGLGFGLLAEMLDRRVRSEGDLAEALQAPVLGVIDWNASTRVARGIKKLFSSVRLRLN